MDLTYAWKACVGVGVLNPNKLYVTREKHLINFYSPRHKRTVRFNLKTQSMEKFYIREKVWKSTQHQYEFFRPYNMWSLQFEDKKFEDLVRCSQKINRNCTSISSYISRLKDVLVYENYAAEGIRYVEPARYWGTPNLLSHRLNEYNKNVIKFFKEVDFMVSPSFEREYFYKEEQFIRIISIIRHLDIEPEEKKGLLSDIIDRREAFNNLVNDYKYDVKALSEYLVNYLSKFENLKPREGIRLLRDYYRMSIEIGRQVKKYPKYLKSMHDIIISNYNAYQQEYDEILFEKVRLAELDYESKKFCIVTPKESKDIIREGTALNHCVGSYIKDVLNKKTYIFFLRETLDKEKSLVTLELKNRKLVQARGSYNRSLTKDESEFLQKFCNKMKIPMEI